MPYFLEYFSVLEEMPPPSEHTVIKVASDVSDPSTDLLFKFDVQTRLNAKASIAFWRGRWWVVEYEGVFDPSQFVFYLLPINKVGDRLYDFAIKAARTYDLPEPGSMA